MGLLQRANLFNLLGEGLTAIQVFRLVRKMSFLREVVVRNRLRSQWASTRNCDLVYGRVCFSEHIPNMDTFYHSKDFPYNQTF